MPSKYAISCASALAVVLVAGCDNGPPGGGLTNGPPPTAIGAEDKPAVRTDLQEPPATGGDAAIDAAAEPVTGPSRSAAASRAGGGANAGAEGAAKPTGETKAGTAPNPE